MFNNNTSKKGVPMRTQFKVMSLVLLGTVMTSSLQANNVVGHTFFTVRPQFQTSMPEKESLFFDRPLARECGIGGAMEFVVFGGRSTGSKGLAQYFSPTNVNQLIVSSVTTAQTCPGGVTTEQNYTRNINPVHFALATGTSYTSTIQFRPRQSTVGFGFDWKQYLGRCDCKKWWVEASFPVINVRNDMHLTETMVAIVGPQAIGIYTPFASMIQAFEGNDFATSSTAVLQFGKINGCRQTTGVADVELKLGYDYLNDECCEFGGYVGVVIPTGNKPKGEYVFEPIVGNNHHWGITFGSNFGAEIWSKCDRTLRFEFETNGRYLFRNTQTRTMDLKFRPWSRYLLVIPSCAANPTPGSLDNAVNAVNYLTQKVYVKPHFQKDLNTALVYNACGFEAELGYNFWARESEKVSLKTPWVPSIAAIDVTGDPACINRLSNIGQDNPGAAVPCNSGSIIQGYNLDLESAAHPCTISNIIYGSLGYAWDSICWPVFVGIGGSYEFTSENTSLQRWTVWGKFGVSI
jgi:hypothetical protein